MTAFTLHQERTAVAEEQLVIGNLRPGGQQQPGLLELITHSQRKGAGIVIQRADAQVLHHRFLRLHRKLFHDARAHGHAVGLQRPDEAHISQILEEELVVDGEGLRGAGSEDVAVLVAHFIGMRVQGAVGRDDAVAVEGTVGGVGRIVVSAEGEVLAVPEGLVLEIPDEASLIGRILAHQVPVIAEVTHGIAHGVGVFALDERAVRVGRYIGFARIGAHIHGADDVRTVIFGEQGVLILDGTGGVVGLDPVPAVHEVGTGTGLVPKAPDNHRRVVEVPLDHTLVADEVGGAEGGVLGQGHSLGIAHAVGFDIALVHHIQAILVAKGQPTGVVGIMAGAHRIDIQLLHDSDIPNHVFFGNDVTFGRMHLMPVGPLDQNGLAVHQELRIPDFHRTETHLERGAFHHGSAGVTGGHVQTVQGGDFSTPGLHALHMGLKGGLPPGHGCGGKGSHGAALGIQKSGRYGFDAGGNIGPDLKGAVGLGDDVDILQALLLARIDIDAAGNAAQPPEILVLQVGAVAPAENLQGNHILPRTNVFGKVEAGFQLAVFAIAHHLSVHPYAHVGSSAADAQIHRFLLPFRRDVEHAAVLPHVVPFLRDDGRIVLVQTFPCIADIHVNGVSVAVELPEAGDGHFVPAGVVVVNGFKAFQAGLHRLAPMETPAAVQGKGLLLVRHEGGMHGEAVLLIDFRVLPGLHFAGGIDGSDGYQCQCCGD